ncbi:hypothetical protein OAH12_00580 [Cyclobacteriaceae bacterium]|nr:hypothetical protein [Cyclobacteriaceae bacterium]
MKIQLQAIHILKQLQQLIIALEAKELTQPLDAFSGSTIGQHTRHILEFYLCLFQQLPTSHICYDKRPRDIKLEEEKSTIISMIDHINLQLSELENDVPLTLSTMLGEVSHNTPTTLSREILNVLEHAVHHMAMLKIGVNLNFQHIQIPNNFGVAESTIRYLATQ